MTDAADSGVRSPPLIIRLWRSPGVEWCFFLFIGLRLGLGAFALAARATHPGPIAPDPVLRPYAGVEPSKNTLLEPWQRWDTLYYQAIAERGYGSFESSTFAPPLYPLLMRWAGSAFAGDTLLGGIVVSNLAYLLALIYFYRLARMEGDDRRARFATVYLAIFPTAFFFFAAYAESLFLLATVAAMYHARRKEWLASGVWAFFAPLARMQGMVLVPVLVYEAVRTWREVGIERGKMILGLAVAGLGALVFPVYAWLGLGKTPVDLLAALRGRSRGRLAIPGAAIVAAVALLLRGDFVQADYFDLGFCLLFVALTVLALWWLPSMYGVYCILMLALILSKVSDFEALLSVSRYVLALFPGFLVLGWLGSSKPWLHRLILYPSLAGLLFLTGQFVLWGWVG